MNEHEIEQAIRENNAKQQEAYRLLAQLQCEMTVLTRRLIDVRSDEADDDLDAAFPEAAFRPR
jgi:hypothetical protein